MLQTPHESMAGGAKVDLLTANTTEQEFQNILKYRPHYMTFFLALADMMLASGAEQLDARGLLSVMRWFGKKYTNSKVTIGNQFSQYFADEGVKRRPDLASLFVRHPHREKKKK